PFYICSPLSFSIALRPPPSSTLFPYTTLFRSSISATAVPRILYPRAASPLQSPSAVWPPNWTMTPSGFSFSRTAQTSSRVSGSRSEEHTSELQSRENLVCRLLLEKKNKHNKHN